MLYSLFRVFVLFFSLAPYFLLLAAIGCFIWGGPAWALLAVGLVWFLGNELAFHPVK